MRLKVLFALLLPAFTALAAEPPVITAIRAGHLLDVANERVLDDVVIVVMEGRVSSIGSDIPSGAEVIDLSDRLVLPGLIDGHTHVMLQGDATSADYDAQILGESLPYRALRASRAMRISLEHGFTTLRDVGNRYRGRNAGRDRFFRGHRAWVAGRHHRDGRRSAGRHHRHGARVVRDEGRCCGHPLTA